MRQSKGQLLRQQKEQTTTYTFTREQLKEHDDKVRREFFERNKAKWQSEVSAAYDAKQKEVDEYLNTEWKKRESMFHTDEFADSFFLLLSLVLSVSTRVLVEKFHWKPLPLDGNFDRRSRLLRFGSYVMDEVNRICSDDKEDIRIYTEETYKLYGLKFDWGEKDDDEQ